MKLNLFSSLTEQDDGETQEALRLLREALAIRNKYKSKFAMLHAAVAINPSEVSEIKRKDSNILISFLSLPSNAWMGCLIFTIQ